MSLSPKMRQLMATRTTSVHLSSETQFSSKWYRRWCHLSLCGRRTIIPGSVGIFYLRPHYGQEHLSSSLGDVRNRVCGKSVAGKFPTNLKHLRLAHPSLMNAIQSLSYGGWFRYLIIFYECHVYYYSYYGVETCTLKEFFTAKWVYTLMMCCILCYPSISSS